MVSSQKSKFLQGSASNLVRIALSMVVSLLLPPFLVRRLSPSAYSAWVLILQLSAYVTYLDLGLQTAVGKFVAEYNAIDDRDSARRVVSTAFSLLSIASLIGVVAVAVLTYRVPSLFYHMPASLYHDVRLGLPSIGTSVCFMLPFSVFLSTFTGLQQYAFPTLFIAISRIASAVILASVVFFGGSILRMAVAMSALNVVTAVTQVFGWKRYASERVPFTLFALDRARVKKLSEYCGILSIWTVGSLLISGLDTTIVGHFDYGNTGYYAVAASATNFMLVLTSNILNPLLPAISSLQTQRTPEQLGELLVRFTRFGVATLLLFGLPLLVGGYPLLTLWLGASYAAKSVVFLDLLVLGNVLRQLGFPYALFIVATGKQRYATVAPIAESLVNITLSLLLARHYGAVGVALGTLFAAGVGLLCHLFISMRYTQSVIAVHRPRLLLQGVLRPCLAALPTLLLIPFWRRFDLWPAYPGLLAAWVITSALILWRVGFTGKERMQLQQQIQLRFARLL